MATMTAAQKNALIKEKALQSITLPEGTIQVGDNVFAIPVEVEGEVRYATITFTAKNNKATKTSPAFDPEEVRADWLADKELKEKVAAEKLAEKERKAKLRTEKAKKNEG